MGSIFILVIVSLIPSVRCDTDEFTINFLEVYMAVEDDGDVLVTEISNIKLKSPKSLIKYDLFTQTPFYVESVKFNEKYQEFKTFKGFPWGKTDLIIQIDSDSMGGKLEVFYTTRIWHSYQQDEAEIFISRFHLRNFEKLDKTLEEIPITIEIPKSFDIKFNEKIIANLRYSTPESPSDLNMYFHALNLYEQHVSESKRYLAILSTEDAYRYEDTTFSLVDVEFVLIIAKDFSYNEYIDYCRINLNASDPENIVARMEIELAKLREAATDISFLPSEDISVEPNYYFDIESKKDEKNESIVRIYYKEIEDTIGITWPFNIEYKIKYDKFARYQTYFYDVFSWRESFFPNPRTFWFTLNIPSDAILLKASPKGDVNLKQNSIKWYENSLPSNPHESQKYTVKYIPKEKYNNILLLFLMILLIFVFFYLLGMRYFLINKHFAGFLLGWTSYFPAMWFLVPLNPIFYDFLALSQIVIIILFVYLFGSQSRVYKFFFASLVITVWFYEDFFDFSAYIVDVAGKFLDFQDVGSKIFAAVILYLTSKYARSSLNRFVIFVRKNAVNMCFVAFVAFLVLLAAHYGKGASFNEKMFITVLLVLFGFSILNPKSSSKKWTIKCKVEDRPIKRNNTCFFNCVVVEVCPKEPFSRKLETRKVVWVKLSNRNGFSVKGLAFDNIRQGQHLTVYGQWINRKEMSGEDAAIIGDMNGIFEARRVIGKEESFSRDIRYIKCKVKQMIIWRLKILDMNFFIDDEESIIFKIIHGKTDILHASQVIESIRAIIGGIDETEVMNAPEVFSMDDMKNFNLILIGTTLSNRLVEQLVINGIRPDDKSPSDWMLHSKGTYKYYTDPYQAGTDIVVISGLDDKEVIKGFQKFIDIGLLKAQQRFKI